MIALSLWTLLQACRHSLPDDGDRDSQGGVDTSAEPEAPVNYGLERVMGGTMADAGTLSQALVNPLTGVTYARGPSSEMVRFVLESGVYPTGDYCVGGSTDDEGNCRGGIIWTSGRIESPARSEAMCLDRDRGELFLVKQGGGSVEVIDVDAEGHDPYSYQRATRNPRIPAELATAGLFTGPCDYDSYDDELVLSSPTDGMLAAMTAGETPAAREVVSLGWSPAALAVSGDRILAWDTTGNRVVALKRVGFAEVGAYTPAETITTFAVERGTGAVWIGHEGSVERVRFSDEGVPEAQSTALDGVVSQLAADPSREVAWVGVERDGAWAVELVQDGTVRGEQSFGGPLLALAEPSATGDLVAFYEATSEAVVSYEVLGLVPDRQILPPLRIFLFTTIEEPSDTNMENPCAGGGSSFENELALVRQNSDALAALGVPVAMAITDNFAQKAEECSQTAIYQELADLGFELGAMLHNRPCYNCSGGGGSANPDSCGANDPNYISAGSDQACFPDDPEYCGLGDYDCYEAFLAPRVDLADRNIPGGARFIVGGDRHGMWDYDWLRLYRTVSRPTFGLTGFTLTMFAGTWAYNDIDYDDPRGKNPAPWHVDRRSATWHPADIDHWDQDSPTSELLYLSGPNSSTVKIGEQQASGLYMLDYFDIATNVAYRPDDFDVQWMNLRSAIANRRPGELNAWYFHIHDTGTVNIRDGAGNSVSTDLDGEGGEDPITVESMLQDFVARIQARYGGTGDIEWMFPTEIEGLDGR